MKKKKTKAEQKLEEKIKELENIDEENPFVSFSPQELRAIEDQLYYIQIGNDVVTDGHKMTFSQKTTAKHYNDTIEKLLIGITNGTNKESRIAKRLMETLRIHPLRIH